MTRKINLIFVLIVLAATFVGCGRPECKNTNPIFDKYSPESKEYKSELVKQLEKVDKSNLSYWFKEYVESNGQDLFLFYIQGDSLCAVIALGIEKGSKLEEFRQKKGGGYRGAEFVNLKYDIKKDSSDIKFVFIDYDKIID